jgi:CRISPR-associated protein Cas5d
MSYGVRLRVWGDYACFTRPEMKVERVSYDVITPSAARGILEAIHWKPAIRWVIDNIYVRKPIRFTSVRRNEVSSKISAQKAATAMNTGSLDKLGLHVDEDRQQRAAMVLRDVDYVIEAHFELTGKASDDTEGKHLDIFNRRLALSQCFHHPCLGTREFAAYFSAIDGPISTPTDPTLIGERDLGQMLYDIDFARQKQPLFYRPIMVDGLIKVARFAPTEARS